MEDELKGLEADLQQAVAAHATAAEKLRRAQQEAAASEQAITDAMAAGVLPEDTGAAAHDAHLAKQAETASQVHEAAEKELERIGTQIRDKQKALASARRRAEDADREVSQGERHLREVNSRVHALAHDERLLAVVGDTGTDPWLVRSAVTDALRQSAETADA